MVSQLEQNEERKKLLNKLKEVQPPAMASARADLSNAVYRDGALSRKVKHLMSAAIAIGSGCANSSLAQVGRSLEHGATAEEIVEMLNVVVAMRGSTGVSESLPIIKLLEEMGKL